MDYLLLIIIGIAGVFIGRKAAVLRKIRKNKDVSRSDKSK